jgi:hypothetical protein
LNDLSAARCHRVTQHLGSVALNVALSSLHIAAGVLALTTHIDPWRGHAAHPQMNQILHH